MPKKQGARKRILQISTNDCNKEKINAMQEFGLADGMHAREL